MLIAPVHDGVRDVDLLYESFRGWQRDSVQNQVLPLIGVCGTRGKSTIIRLVEAMLVQAHLRTATWTDLGVEIQGRKQSGELAGWSRAVARLSEGSIDVALQELDWSTVNAAGLPHGTYPCVALSGLREHLENPERSPSLQRAIRSAQRCIEAVHHNGFIVVNVDDHYALDAVADADAVVLAASQSYQTPAMQQHLQDGGAGMWVRNGYIWMGDARSSTRVVRLADVPITMAGEASFNVTNVLMAIGIARGIGLDTPLIVRALEEFRAAWDLLPASMNVYRLNDSIAVIDQLGPGWVIKSVLRAINPGAERRQVTVVGNLDWIDPEDAYETGRQLGRYHGALVMHGDQTPERLAAFKRGLAANPYPPLYIWLPTERRAINRAFKTLKRKDVLLILTTHDSSAAHRAVRRHIASKQ